jgi:hypothetical protein
MSNEWSSSIRAVAMAGILILGIGCGSRTDLLAEAPSCQVYLAALDACARTAAPSFARDPLVALGRTLRAAAEAAPSETRFEEACAFASLGASKGAETVCPGVGWTR